jgi:DNA-binding SARP family transcriptional activator
VRALVAQARARQDVALARATLERALELDPLDEDLLRELLRLLADVGEHGVALGRYERWRALRSKSLGLEPAAATQSLAALIRAAATP